MDCFLLNFHYFNCLNPNIFIMGCDGGTIPRRDELVRLKKKPEQVIFSILKFDYQSPSVTKHRLT